MNKKRTLFLLMMLVQISLYSQYADKGTSPLKNHIWWLDWSGITMTNGATRLFSLPNGLEVRAEFSGVSGPLLSPHSMKTWSEALLYNQYDFTNTNIKPALFNTIFSNQSRFTIKVTAKRNGTSEPFTLIASDAEGSDNTEISTFVTSGSPWEMVDFFRTSSQNNSPVKGCSTTTISISETYLSAGFGQNPLVATESSLNGEIIVSVTLDELQAGGMAVAFGILTASDRGDLPPSYGSLEHKINFDKLSVCNYNPPFPTLKPVNKLFLGSLPPDADSYPAMDDNANKNDEDAILSFPPYDRSGMYSLTIPFVNTTGLDAYLTGWMDMNQNGIFDSNESVAAKVSNNQTSIIVSWPNIPSSFPSLNNYAFRFRLSTNENASKAPAGYASDGEVEDYFVPIIQSTLPPAMAGFEAPDTVCANSIVPINNTSINSATNIWRFCLPDINRTPTAVNLGNIGNALSIPTFIEIVEDQGKHYAFITNLTGSLVRLDFGNSLFNTPTAFQFGNFNGQFPIDAEGLKVVKANGKWYVIAAGGNPQVGNISKIVKIELGTDIANNNPVLTNWGNIGGLANPMEIHIFQEGNNWFGLTVNSVTSTITRFNFGTGFDTPPTAVNLGNIGNLTNPGGLFVINEEEQYHIFITNAVSNTITRLDFGSSLANTPTGVNLGNPNNVLNDPRDICIIKYCSDSVIAFVMNGERAPAVVRLNFSSGILSAPRGTNLGSPGNLSFPHSISQLQRINSDIYFFVTNARNSTITRFLISADCSDGDLPNSSETAPSSLSYPTPGTYNISLTINEGLSNQSSFCKKIVVVGKPQIPLLSDTIICPGNPVSFNGTAIGATSYKWSPSEGLSSDNVPNPISSPLTTTNYKLVAANGSCTAEEEVSITVLTEAECLPAMAGFEAPDTVCANSIVPINNTSINSATNIWRFCLPDINRTPTAVNLGNIGNALSIPTFIEIVEDQGKHYAFITNLTGSLVRLDFGNSLFNTPTAFQFGNFNGQFPIDAEGLKVVKANGKWYVIAAGGNPQVGNISKIVKIELGTDIANNNPVLTNWGNIGGLANPMEIHIFQEGNNWFGLTVNSVTSTITRFNFGTGFDTPPTAVNLGNIGNLRNPGGLFVINEEEQYHIFITNAVSNTITRLDFGSSLANTPTGVNLGNPNNVLNDPRDICIIKYCSDSVIAFVMNGERAPAVVRLNFSSGILSAPRGTNLGSPGNLSFPHSISQLQRINSDIYFFVTNARNSTITRFLISADCSDGDLPNSSETAPSSLSYPTPGTYNISLTINEGRSNQSSFCKKIVVLPKPTVDFTFEQLLCDPQSVQFRSLTTYAKELIWQMGDGTTLFDIPDTLFSYTQYGTYQVRLKAIAEGGCSDSSTKEITVQLFQDSAIIGSDTTMCFNGNFQLNALPGLSYCWSPATGLSSTDIANPFISTPLAATTYYLTTRTTSTNLINNGDFSQGNTGFLSEYRNSPDNGVPQGVYGIRNDVSPWHPNLADCKDHTSGNGNMMLVNGSLVAGEKIWSQEITIKPHTTYAFSTWLLSLISTNPAKLQFSINGVQLGNGFIASGTTCSWNQFYTTWYSEENTKATISIINMNVAQGGNDFALDDISFSEIRMVRDSITVTINANPSVDYEYTIPFCKSPQFTGIDNNSPAPMAEWSWQFGDSTSEKAEVLTHSYISGGSYDVKLLATDMNGCKDSITKTIQLDTVTALISADTIICPNTVAYLSGGGGIKYEWYPSSGNEDISSAEITSLVSEPTRFYLKVTDGIECTDTASVLVDIIPSPNFQRPKDMVMCMDSVIQLDGSNPENYSYHWYPEESLNDPLLMKPLASPGSSTQYSLDIAEPVCGYDTSFTIFVQVNPNPLVSAWKQHDIDCVNPTTFLGASGANEYLWTPSNQVDHPSKPNAMVWADSTTAFIVRGMNHYGCMDFDTVVVSVSKTGEPFFPVPNAFTPNNDGKNDCFSIQRWGGVTIRQMEIFNRWGRKLFSTSDPLDCWDGKYNGQLQETGQYIYIIRADSFCGPITRKGIVILVR